jgi:hypothetical protein
MSDRQNYGRSEKLPKRLRIVTPYDASIGAWHKRFLSREWLDQTSNWRSLGLETQVLQLLVVAGQKREQYECGLSGQSHLEPEPPKSPSGIEPGPGPEGGAVRRRRARESAGFLATR